MVNNKHAFWIALIFTIAIFGIGLVIGYFFEGYMTNKANSMLVQSEINLLDEQIRDSAIYSFGINCSDATESLFNFADKIYSEAYQLEEWDKQAKFTSELTLLHQKYDLLRIMLWEEGISIKERCGNDSFHTVVYFFNYDPEQKDVQISARQKTYERILDEIKANYADKILLIPVAGNLGLESVNLIMKKYGISGLPSILVDENSTKIATGEVTTTQIKNIIF